MGVTAMGMRSWLAERAVRRVHVLVVEVPGRWATRVAVQRAVTQRGWVEATSAADADALVVCGTPGRRLAEAIDRVWDQLPGPRARAEVELTDNEQAGVAVQAAVDGAVEGAADGALDRVAAALMDDLAQRADAAGRSSWSAGMADAGEMAGDTAGDDGMDHGGMDDMDMGDMDMGDMDMGDMDMGDMSPGGIALAGGAEDRDGLEMDVLHVPLGPVLPHWPAGLVLRCTVAGDVVTEAEAEVLPAAAPHLAQGRVPADAWWCDQAAAVLALAGWNDAAAQAQQARDLLLAGEATAATATAARLRVRVARSRILRWQLRDLGSDARPDVRERLLDLLDRAAGQLGNNPPAAAVTDLPDLVPGLELAAVRLLVASLALDTTAAEPVTSHG